MAFSALILLGVIILAVLAVVFFVGRR